MKQPWRPNDGYAVRSSQRIIEHYDDMTKSQRKLADFLLSNSPEVALMTSADLAKEMKVSEATVVRFAQLLGFRGYPELRQHLQHKLLKELRSSERLATTVHARDEDATGPSPLQTVVETTQAHLQQLLNTVSEEDLTSAVARIVRARRLFLFGEGAPASVTHLAEFWFNRLGSYVIRVNQTGRRFFDHTFNVGEGDLGIVFAFRRVLPEPQAFVEHLSEQGGESMVITDLVRSSLHTHVDQVLLVGRGPMETFRPMGALVALVDALILGVMQAKGDEGVEHLRHLDDWRQRHGFL